MAGEPRAELRGGRLEVADRPVAVAVPYLVLDRDGGPGDSGDDRAWRRGVVDGLALRVRHSDPELHRQLSPRPLLERVVFDIAEQFRCEALADPALAGVRANTAAAFQRWSDAAQAARVGETGVGLLVFTITHMLRARLLRVPTSEAVDELIEVTRGNLGRLVGHALRELPSLVGSQRRYAEAAAEIARLLAELVADAAEAAGEAPDVIAGNALLVPVDWDLLDELSGGPGAAPGGGRADDADDADDGYRVHTTAYDVVVAGDDLYRAPVLRRLRTELDRQVAAQAVSIARLAQRLQPLFSSPVPDGWRGGEEDGLLDPARLAQLVADPTNRLVHRRLHHRPAGDAVVTFLVDTSGSMKLQRHESVAVLVDTMVRALELAGVTSEVLGFTTGAWAGGRALADWRASGSPPEPGRLNELQHIVYKPADRRWRQARLGIAAMLRTDHYREGVDGEALDWAHARLLARPEPRRVLVVISDGTPTDAATANHNPDGFLADHLTEVARRIERDGRVQLGAVGIDRQLDDHITSSIGLDLSGTLTIGTYDLLHRLFA